METTAKSPSTGWAHKARKAKKALVANPVLPVCEDCLGILVPKVLWVRKGSRAQQAPSVLPGPWVPQELPVPRATGETKAFRG